MFWNEEDIQPTVTMAEQVFGKQGQYQLSPFVYVSVETAKFGTIWYGDVSGTTARVKELAEKLAGKLGDKITVRDLATSNILFN